MKKLLLIALVAIVFVACEKENPLPKAKFSFTGNYI
jgi:hypothetical protein